ncbi:CLUMA_CG015414, isoform A [Clunio marinus]|uniref:CLUMA_CG015414, isoform A n=1 Tax=Clunio marinus TaxID=568069 RepID=A0A1J1INP0_9DIPT|nr:CLUMA_CG015414, isoform A [Clunio marinus]
MTTPNTVQKKFSFIGVIDGVINFNTSVLKILNGLPMIVSSFVLLIINEFLSLFTNRSATVGDHLLNGEKVLIIGSDTMLGRAFSIMSVKMGGTVICIDKSREHSDHFIKLINEEKMDTKAYFYECDSNRKDSITQTIDAVTKDFDAIDIVVNCMTSDVVQSYFNFYHAIFPIMKTNNKGHLVFIRTFDFATRAAIKGLFEKMNHDLKDPNACNIKTSLVHVFPKFDNGENVPKEGIFANILLEDLACNVFIGVAKNKKHIYVPDSMNIFGFLMTFIPSPLVAMFENLFFSD